MFVRRRTNGFCLDTCPQILSGLRNFLRTDQAQNSFADVIPRLARKLSNSRAHASRKVKCVDADFADVIDMQAGLTRPKRS
jgi:hypothetical protein